MSETTQQAQPQPQQQVQTIPVVTVEFDRTMEVAVPAAIGAAVGVGIIFVVKSFFFDWFYHSSGSRI